MLPRLTNQTLGKQFELRLIHQARLNGLLILHAGTQVKYLKGGSAKAVRSDLDFKLYDRERRHAAFDSKSFGADYFTYSQLTAHQVARSERYAQWNITSGFVVLFRRLREVYWYPIQFITLKGRRARFGPADGVLLGPETYFLLTRILKP